MKRLTILFIIILALQTLFAQPKADYIWLGGQDHSFSTSVLGFRFDFNNKPFQVSKVDNGFTFNDNIASICDKNGELLFYSNGCAVINAEAQIMPNGDSINYNEWYSIFTDGICEYGYPGNEDILILPDPGYDDGYYLFHKANVYFPDVKDSFKLMMSYVDMQLDENNGDVLFKNIPYYDRYNLMYSYFTAIQHENGKDWWILQPLVEDSIFLTFLLDENGLVRIADQNTHEYFDKHRSSASGTAKFSSDGTRYALYNFYDQLHLYDFDRETGLLSNHQKINIYEEDSIEISDIRFSSVEWSSNSRFIYIACRDELFQVDTWEENIHDGIRLIDEYNGTLDPFPTTFHLMVQGPDCRIYMRSKNGSDSYHVINYPDSLGKACDFIQNGIKLPVPSGGGLPNFPRFRVDEEEKCDPTIVSVFGEAVWFRRDLKIWPNPSSGYFNVELPEGRAGTLVVTNMNGMIIWHRSQETSTIRQGYGGQSITSIDLSHLSSGVYNVEFYPEDNMDRLFYSIQVVLQ